MAALPPALPHFLQEAFPDFLCPECPYVRLCTLLPDLCVCMCPAHTYKADLQAWTESGSLVYPSALPPVLG